MQGKILIVNKLDGSIFGWFGETNDNSRPDLEDITLLELEPNQYQSGFMNLAHGIESINVIDIENKILEFEKIQTKSEPTYEDLQQQLLEVQGVI